MNPSIPPLCDNFIGEIDDVFYHFAQARKNETSELIKIYQKALKVESLARLTGKFAPFAFIFKQKTSLEMQSVLNAYAKGSDRTLDEIKLLLYLPDFLSAYHHFTPELMSLIPGCSSLIYKDDTGSSNHIRILDFSMTEFFKNNEELIQFQIKDCYRFTSVSLKGFPISLFTLVNDQGLTLALHQKMSQKWNTDGENIFSIMLNVITKAKDTKEVKEILKSTQSLTHWGIVALDKDNQILHAELGGTEHLFEIYQLKKDNFFYFNRLPIKKLPSTLPSLIRLSEKQKNYINQSFKNFKIKSKSNIDLFINLTNHFNEMPLENNLITLSSVQVVNICPSKDQLVLKLGPAPKATGKYIVFENLFQETSYQEYEIKKDPKELTDFNIGLMKIATAASLYDIGEKEQAFHEMQMGFNYIEEGPLFYFSKFIFLIWQYISFKNKNDLLSIYKEFNDIKDFLPETLADHAKLFIMRIEKSIGLEITIGSKDIQSEYLKELYLKEIKLKSRAFKLLKYLIFPRLELFDIIYLY